jgi:hypothetical protein
MIPVAKGLGWQRNADELLIVFDSRKCLRMPDPGGQVERLLMLLRDGPRTPAAGITLQIDFTRGCTTTSQAWQRHPDCPTCAGAPAGGGGVDRREEAPTR